MATGRLSAGAAVRPGGPRGLASAVVPLTAGLVVLALVAVATGTGGERAPVGTLLAAYAAAAAAAFGVARAASLSVASRATGVATLVPAGLALVVTLFAVEALVRAYRVPAAFVPAPTAVLEALAASRVVLLRDAGVTLLEAGVGYLAGSALGIGLALLVTRYRFLELGLMPYASLLSSVPIVALAPVIIKAAGLEWPSKAAIVAVTVLFPVLLNAARGLADVHPLSLDLMRSYAATDRQVLGSLRVPAALPHLFNGLKLATTLALIGAIVGEFFGAVGRGLGFRILVESGISNLAIVWAAIVVASAVGITWYGLTAALERRLTGWHASNRAPV